MLFVLVATGFCRFACRPYHLIMRPSTDPLTRAYFFIYLSFVLLIIIFFWSNPTNDQMRENPMGCCMPFCKPVYTTILNMTGFPTR